MVIQGDQSVISNDLKLLIKVEDLDNLRNEIAHVEQICKSPDQSVDFYTTFDIDSKCTLFTLVEKYSEKDMGKEEIINYSQEVENFTFGAIDEEVKTGTLIFCPYRDMCHDQIYVDAHHGVMEHYDLMKTDLKNTDPEDVFLGLMDICEKYNLDKVDVFLNCWIKSYVYSHEQLRESLTGLKTSDFILYITPACDMELDKHVLEVMDEETLKRLGHYYTSVLRRDYSVADGLFFSSVRDIIRFDYVRTWSMLGACEDISVDSDEDGLDIEVVDG